MPIKIVKGGAASRTPAVVEGGLLPKPDPSPRDPRECPFCHWLDGRKCSRDTYKNCFRGQHLVRKPAGSR